MSKGEFVKQLEKRPMSSWSNIELAKYQALTDQLCLDCGEVDCICAKKRKCFDCGCTIDADDPCCSEPMEDESEEN